MPVRAAVPEGEAVVAGEADDKSNSKGKDVRGQRRDVRAFNGKRQYGEVYGSGCRADEEEIAPLRGGRSSRVRGIFHGCVRLQ